MATGAIVGFLTGVAGVAGAVVVTAAVVGVRTAPTDTQAQVAAPPPAVLSEPARATRPPATIAVGTTPQSGLAPARAAQTAALAPQPVIPTDETDTATAPRPSIGGATLPAQPTHTAADISVAVTGPVEDGFDRVAPTGPAVISTSSDQVLAGRSTQVPSASVEGAPQPREPQTVAMVARPDAVTQAPVARSGIGLSVPEQEFPPQLTGADTGGEATVSIRNGFGIANRSQPVEGRRIAAIGTPPDALPPAVVPITRPAEEPRTASLGTPGVSLLARPDAVPTRRFGAAATDAEDAAGRLPPLQAFATPFDVDATTPRLAVVLIHDGAQVVDADALAGLPFSVTVAIDPDLPDAVDVSQAYRDAGVEVMVLIDVPQGTEAPDASAATQAALRRVPGAIGVFEGVVDGVQFDRAVSSEITTLAAQAGLGLIVQQRSLNSMEKQALREGVPAATVYRDFDGAGQTVSAMHRFLDQAAFRARQDGGVIMMGRARADTLSALTEWGQKDRGDLLQLVPVSNILLAPPA